MFLKKNEKCGRQIGCRKQKLSADRQQVRDRRYTDMMKLQFLKKWTDGFISKPTLNGIHHRKVINSQTAL